MDDKPTDCKSGTQLQGSDCEKKESSANDETSAGDSKTNSDKKAKPTLRMRNNEPKISTSLSDKKQHLEHKVNTMLSKPPPQKVEK